MEKSSILIFFLALFLLAGTVTAIPPLQNGGEYEQSLKVSQQFHEQAELVTTIGMLLGVAAVAAGGVVYSFKEAKKPLAKKLIIGGVILFVVTAVINILSKIITI